MYADFFFKVNILKNKKKRFQINHHSFDPDQARRLVVIYVTDCSGSKLIPKFKSAKTKVVIRRQRISQLK